jgi:ribonuclease PH
MFKCILRVQVHCFVLECGGSEAAALAMAAALAVADAQIDMRCTLSAASLVRSSS